MQLTQAEREAIDENRTGSLQAFLAYGQGLQALDNGDYPAAQQFFQQAADIDPGFGPAQTQLQGATDLLQATNAPVNDVAQRGTEEVEREVVSAGGVSTREGPITVAGGLGGTLSDVSEGVDPTPNAGTIDRIQPEQPGQTPTQQQQQEAQQTKRQPIPESRGQEQPAGTTQATIRITIRRPGGE